MASIQTQPHAMTEERNPTPQVDAKRLCTLGMLAYLALLVAYSIYLSLSRIIQVDECQSLYMARVLATGQAHQFFTDASLFLLGPLAWITRNFQHSEQMFDVARLLFLGIFWLNISLMAAIASGRLFCFRGLVALVAAASFAPVWDYGFEIRHDNLVVTGVLLIWWTVRVKQWGSPAYLLAGAITVACLCMAVKAIVYVIPLSGALLLLPPPGNRKSRLQLTAAWLGGAVLAAVLIRIAYGSSGAWGPYLDVVRGVGKIAATGKTGEISTRFWPGVALDRLPEQTPLLLALCLAACLSAASALIRKFRESFTWDSYVPEAFLFLGAFADLFLNPAPFPYNLLHLVPYAFLLSFRYCLDLWPKIQNVPVLRPALVGVLIFTNFLPFIMATERHLDFSNSRQKLLMNVAEDLTDPVSDPVYDGIGMVPTRPSSGHQWYLHSLNLNMLTTPGLQVRDMLAAKPAAVVIFSYRTDWLPKEDIDFIRSRYIPLADDISVLGTSLPAGGGTFQIFHPGRYCVIRVGSQPEESSATKAPDAVSGTLDGKPISAGPVQLDAGTHKIETSPDQRLAAIWVGPVLQGVPLLPAGNHRALFFNWY